MDKPRRKGGNQEKSKRRKGRGLKKSSWKGRDLWEIRFEHVSIENCQEVGERKRGICGINARDSMFSFLGRRARKPVKLKLIPFHHPSLCLIRFAFRWKIIPGRKGGGQVSNGKRRSINLQCMQTVLTSKNRRAIFEKNFSPTKENRQKSMERCQNLFCQLTKDFWTSLGNFERRNVNGDRVWPIVRYIAKRFQFQVRLMQLDDILCWPSGRNDVKLIRITEGNLSQLNFRDCLLVS